MPVIESKLFAYGVAAAAALTGLWAYQRKTAAAPRGPVGIGLTHPQIQPGTYVPQDDELNVKPYYEDRYEAHRRRLDEDARRAKARVEEVGEKVVDKAGRAVGEAEARLARGAADAQAGLERGMAEVEDKTREAGAWARKEVDRADKKLDAFGREIKADVDQIEREGRGIFSRLVGGRPKSDTSDTSSTATTTTSPSPFTDAQSSYVINDKLVQGAELEAMRAEERAREAKALAERVAAEAAAAVAAGTAFGEKVAQDRTRVEALRQEAKALEDAYRLKAQQAKEAEKLVYKDQGYQKEAESTANKKLKEEDSRLKEAARLEELARSRQLQAEQTRLEAAETQRRAAEAAARRAEEQRLAATRLFEAEQAAARQAHKRAEENERLARQAQSPADDARRAEEYRKREEEVSRQLADLDRKRRDAEAAAARARVEVDRAAREAQLARAEEEAHDRAARQASQSMMTAEQQWRAAHAAEEQAQGVASRVKGWLGMTKSAPVVAEAHARGEAQAVREFDPAREKGTSLGTTVVASGRAAVSMRDSVAGAGPLGGRQTAVVERSEQPPNRATAHVAMEESSRAMRR